MAWPGPRGCRHMLVIGVGCALDAPNEEMEEAKRIAKQAPRHVMGSNSDITPAPNAIEEWTDLAGVSCLMISLLTVSMLTAMYRSTAVITRKSRC